MTTSAIPNPTEGGDSRIDSKSFVQSTVVANQAAADGTAADSEFIANLAEEGTPVPGASGTPIPAQAAGEPNMSAVEDRNLPKIDEKPAGREERGEQAQTSREGNKLAFARSVPRANELIRSKEGKIKFGIVEPGPKLIVASRLLYEDRAYQSENLKLPRDLYHSLVLPTDVAEYGSTQSLFDSIRVLLSQYAGIPEEQCRLITYWALATWFPDALPFVPCLVLSGHSFVADGVMRLLGRVCRFPVPLVGLNPGILHLIPFDTFTPTLLIRETQLSKRTLALLEGSDQPGYFVVSGRNLVRFYCAKCIYVGDQKTEMPFGASAIQIHLEEPGKLSSRQIPSDETLQDLQNRLFTYRWFNRPKVSSSELATLDLLPELSAVAHILSACVVDDLKLAAGVIELLKGRDDQARVDRAYGERGMVVKAVLWHCHQNENQQVLVRDIAATVNRLYLEDGEPLKVSSESVGHMLKKLGLFSRRLGSTGRGLVLDKATKLLAHELAGSYQVILDSESEPCGYCHEVQVPEINSVM